jgi:ABC-2 type transport system permease protein
MEKTGVRLGEGLRIVGAIATKDIVDAIRNRTTLTLLFAVILIMLQGQALPMLLGLTHRLPLAVYDQGRSQLVDRLRADAGVTLIKADSQQALEDALTGVRTGGLGLVIPPDFDQVLDSGSPVELEGYYAWVDRSRAVGLQSRAEQLLAELLGRPARIDVDGHVVYPLPGAQGFQTMVALVLVLVIVMVGAFIVPYLMFEEKEARTLDVLLVSPASIRQVVLGKALAGSFYCLTASAVALAFHGQWVAHWWLAIVATLMAALLAVGLGLLLGSVFENAQQMGLWAGIPLLLLILPILVGDLATIPAAVRTHVIPWIPTVALGKAFRLSFAGSAPLGQAMAPLAIAAAWTALVLAGVVSVVRRSDR